MLDYNSKRLRFTFTSKPLKPSVSVQIGDKVLLRDVDYEVMYSDNIDVGNGYVWVSGKGVYMGTKPPRSRLRSQSWRPLHSVSPRTTTMGA